MLINKQHLTARWAPIDSNFEKNILELISKACAYYSQGVLVLAVFVQDGVPAFVGEGCLYPNN